MSKYQENNWKSLPNYKQFTFISYVLILAFFTCLTYLMFNHDKHNLLTILITALWAGFAGQTIYWVLFYILKRIDTFIDPKNVFKTSYFEEFKTGKFASIIGIVERIIFVFIIHYGYPAFPFLWVSLKAGVQSKKWNETASRDSFDAFLILNILSIMISFFAIWFMLDFTLNWDEIKTYLGNSNVNISIKF